MSSRNQVFKDKIAYIKAHHDCLTYARCILGWPVNNDGDRYISLAPGSDNPTALVLHIESWHDFKTGWGGDVIDLCAAARHDGDKGAAIRELGEGFKGSWDESDWKAKTQTLCNKIEFWHTQLRPEDIEYLHSRRINDETIERLKIGYDYQTQRIWIPYFKNGYAAYAAGRDRYPVPAKYIDSNGNPIDGEMNLFIVEHTLKEDKRLPDGVKNNPEYDAYLKLNRSKYQKLSLDGYNENIPWGLHTLAPDFRKSKNAALCERFPQAKDILSILEGMFDVISFEQEGFFCLSPIGGFFSKKLNQFVVDTAKQFKRVFICFDSDGPGSNFNMSMAKLMFSHRVPFVIGRLPEYLNGKKIKDVSDYYTAGGDLIELVKNAQDGIIALAETITDKNEFKEFIYKAARYVDKPDLIQLFDYVDDLNHFDHLWLTAVKKECLKAPSEKIIIDELLKSYMIKYSEGESFYIYDRAGYWKSYTDNAVKNIIAQALGVYANGGRLSTILSYLKAKTTTKELFNRQNVFNFPNGVLDLESGELKEHSAIYLSSIQMNYSYKPDADCPKWEKFIYEIMDGDEAKMDLIQEMAGYVLFPDLRLQKCFVLQGEGANGKSVLINVLRKVFGEENCTNVSMSMLGNQFEPIRTKDSLVNFSSETETNLKGAEQIFKALVAGDVISAAHKGKDAIEFSSRSVQIMSTNGQLKSSDTSKGMIRRIIFIRFLRTFEGKDANKNLTQELCGELPGIFNWVYEGYKRLMQNLAFTVTSENKQLIQDFLNESDPVEVFYIEEAVSYSGNYDAKELYEKYVEWCKASGHQIQSRNKFTRSFKNVLLRHSPHAKITRGKYGYTFNFDTVNDTENDIKTSTLNEQDTLAEFYDSSDNPAEDSANESNDNDNLEEIPF
ncbi:MAG: toprim domain-containing protein [Synergistaceae bacterium]|nr:toprim domain-containing protein [Synergistaceae bacterium]